jgi:CHASE3 domain sensor protein
MSSFQNKTGTQSMNGIINISDGVISIENGVITYDDGTTQNTAFSPAILAQVNSNTIKLTNVSFNLGTTTITGTLVIPINSII